MVMPAKTGPDHARQVELNRVEGDSVREVFFLHQFRHEGLVRRASEGLRRAHNEGEREDVPDLRDSGGEQYGE